ncbi:hypothetical protein Rhe02_83930 [Rhizocola hellebori]|uniref:Uncharacterized protein n=1 Tax=Rhizocola hellebori TaxID=1392758 RepID=A0A8J3QJK3_9ACTN|nr:hypothetical protein Rhe02_83930 [Rhizocola hellebori]
MEWVRCWRVTVEFRDELMSSPRTRRYQREVSTAEEIRALIDRARKHPHFIRHTEESVRVLDGKEPTDCPCGAQYNMIGDPGRGVRRWRPCTCGGHFVYTCQACRLVVVDPSVLFDCHG